MNMGMIGTGDIGEVIIRKLRDARYSVKTANSKGPQSLKDLAPNTGAIPVSVEQVVQDVLSWTLPGNTEGLLGSSPAGSEVFVLQKLFVRPISQAAK